MGITEKIFNVKLRAILALLTVASYIGAIYYVLDAFFTGTVPDGITIGDLILIVQGALSPLAMLTLVFYFKTDKDE